MVGNSDAQPGSVPISLVLASSPLAVVDDEATSSHISLLLLHCGLHRLKQLGKSSLLVRAGIPLQKRS